MLTDNREVFTDEWPYGIGQNLINNFLMFQQGIHGAQQLLVIDSVQTHFRQADCFDPP
ncbi:MAG: hypothetical protein GX040_12710 [Alcaligenaceae bacterium]|nr:hypothetical protein [Alcaligenaceae bacterium]